MCLEKNGYKNVNSEFSYLPNIGLWHTSKLFVFSSFYSRWSNNCVNHWLSIE